MASGARSAREFGALEEERKVDLRQYLRIGEAERDRFKKIYQRYKRLHEDPQHCTPMVIINVPSWTACGGTLKSVTIGLRR